jgi:hypothetical protein
VLNLTLICILSTVSLPESAPNHGGCARAAGAPQEEEGFGGLLGPVPMDRCHLCGSSNFSSHLLQHLSGRYVVCHEVREEAPEAA